MSSESELAKKRQWYRDYKTLNADRLKYQDRIRHRELRAKLLTIIGDHKCKDCGNNDYRVLQFDHLNDKKCNVSAFIGRNWEKALAEARKCEVVCANCHSIRTLARLKVPEIPEAKWSRRSKTHCPQGHEKTSENQVVYGGRHFCKLCRRERSQDYRKNNREKHNAAIRKWAKSPKGRAANVKKVRARRKRIREEKNK